MSKYVPSWFFYVSLMVAAALPEAQADCRVRITVPDGGVVHTASGQLACEEGITCEIELTDPECDQTFIASPAYGHRFGGWKKQEHGLCGGQPTNTCNVKEALSIEPPEEGGAGNSVYALVPLFVEEPSHEKPERMDVNCRVEQCESTLLGERHSAADPDGACARLLSDTVRIKGVGAEHSLQVLHGAFANKMARGSFEALPGSAAGWRFVGQAGQPASQGSITLVVEANEELGRCRIEYVEDGNTPEQKNTILTGRLERN